MELAKVTSKGQITIPIAIRNALGIREGDKILFMEEGNRVILTNASTNALLKAQEAFQGAAEEFGIKNEEDVIGRCLECVKDVVDEIIIVDTGSNDSTIEIVKKYTDQVYHFNWVDDFSKARNYAFSRASKDYIMWLDADDVIFENDLINLKQLKNNLDTSVDMVMMKYNVAFDEYNNPTLSYYRERLMSRKKNYQWISPIH